MRGKTIREYDGAKGMLPYGWKPPRVRPNSNTRYSDHKTKEPVDLEPILILSIGISIGLAVAHFIIRC